MTEPAAADYALKSGEAPAIPAPDLPYRPPVPGWRPPIGLIGAGVISAQYLGNLTRFPDLEVRFVADIDLDRAKARAEEFGVPRSGTTEELLADDGIDIVVNLTLPSVHAEVDLQIIAAGKHVFSEKPFSLDRESGLELLALAAGRLQNHPGGRP